MNLRIETHGDIKILRVKEDILVYSMLGAFFSDVLKVIEEGALKLVLALAEVS
jgi:hypothetical protein